MNLELRVVEIQNSVAVEKNELKSALIRDMKQNVLQIARKHCLRAITESDDEFSIAVKGLNEAIDHFKPEKNAKFITFATKLIHNKLTDYFRHEKVVREWCVGDDKIAQISDKKNYSQYINVQLEKELAEERREELRRFSEILKKDYGLTIRDIQKNRPSHRDSIEKIKMIAQHIVQSNLSKRFLEEKLCSKDLEKLIGERRRTLNKYRPYLIGLIIIYIYFPTLKEHLWEGCVR